MAGGPGASPPAAAARTDGVRRGVVGPFRHATGSRVRRRVPRRHRRAIRFCSPSCFGRAIRARWRRAGGRSAGAQSAARVGQALGVAAPRDSRRRREDLARAVAVLGNGAAPTTAGALAELSERTSMAAMEALVEAQIFTNDAQLCFVHPLMRAVVYDDIAPVARAVWHRKQLGYWQSAWRTPGSVATQLLAAERTGGSLGGRAPAGRVLHPLVGAVPQRWRASSPSGRWSNPRRPRSAPPSYASLPLPSSTSATWPASTTCAKHWQQSPRDRNAHSWYCCSVRR